MHTIRSWSCCILLAFCCSATAAELTNFVDFSLTNPSRGAYLLPGRLYIPPEASSGPRRPLILYLSGASGEGTNNIAQVNVNIDNLLAEAKSRGVFLYAPQYLFDRDGKTTSDRTMLMIDRAIANYAVDASRIYVTGISRGGGSVWNFLNRYGERFAAGVPISAVVPYVDYAPSNLTNDSVWAFHARNDQMVNVSQARNRINEILTVLGETLPTYPSSGSALDFHFDAPQGDLHYTEFSTGGHGIWPMVYATPSMYDWLFAHTSEPPRPQLRMQETNGSIAISWPTNQSSYILEKTIDFTVTSGWITETNSISVEGTNFVYHPAAPLPAAEFFRLRLR